MNTLAWHPGTGFVFLALDVLFTIAAIVVLAWAADRFFASKRPALRSSLWHGALAGVLLSPALILVGIDLPWHVGLLAPELAERPIDQPGLAATSAPDITPLAAREHQPEKSEVGGSNQPHVAGGPPVTELPATAIAPGLAAPHQGLQRIDTSSDHSTQSPLKVSHLLSSSLCLIWVLGSAYLIARLMHGWWTIHRLWRNAQPIRSTLWSAEMVSVARQLSVRRIPTLHTSREVGSPLLVGLLKPRLLIPELLLEHSTARQIREICTHECAHIVRRDPWTRLLQRLAMVLFWVHPLVHLLNRRLSQAREEVCDNFVLQHADAADYAETLLSVAQAIHPARSLPGYLTMIPPRQNLADRVAGLLDARRDRATRASMVQRATVAAVLSLTLLAFASVGLQAGSRAQVDPGQEASREPALRQNQATPATGTVSGKVVNATDNRPVGGASVWMISADGYEGDAPKCQTTANSQGEFSFDRIPPGRYRIAAVLGNHTSRINRFSGGMAEVPTDGIAKPVLLRMRPGIAIRVRVLALANGKPIQGARVRAGFKDLEPTYVTDAQGEARLQGLTPERWPLVATADGYAREFEGVDLAKEQPAVREFRLAPGGSLQGHVHDKQGRPIPNLEIDLNRTEFGPFSLLGVSTKTDAAGAYRFDNLPLGQDLQISFRFNVDYLNTSKPFILDAKNTHITGFDLVLNKRPPGGSVKGLVTDREGNPIVGAEIINRGMSSVEVRRTKTDLEGRFLLEDIFSGSPAYSITVVAKGYSAQRVDFKPGREGQPAQVSVKLEPGHRIKARLADENGKAVADAEVFYASKGAMGRGSSNLTSTDAQGRFEFDSLPADALFGIRSTGYSSVRDLKLPLDGDNEVVVTVKSEGIIKGKVLDAAKGTPVPQFTVRIAHSPDGGPVPQSRFYGNRNNPGEEFSSAAGDFLLKELDQGEWLQVTVSAPGYSRLVVRRVEAKSAAEVQPVEFRLTKEDTSRHFTLKGKLVNHRDEPIYAANVVLIVARNRPLRQDAGPYDWQAIKMGRIEQAPAVLQVQRKTTAADGTFTFPDLPADAELELAYWGRGFPRARRDNLQKLPESERGNLLVKALAPARIVGTVDRTVFPELHGITLGVPANLQQVALADDGKSFAIEGLPPGRFDIQLTARLEPRPGDRPGMFRTKLIGRKTLILKEGEEAKIAFGEADKFKLERP